MAEPNVFNFNARPWAPGEDEALLRSVGSAPTPWEGLKAASTNLGRSLSACKNRYAKLRARGIAPEAPSPAHRALHRLARAKGRLGAQDIEQVARATGLHYHAALSTLASLHARGAIAGPCPGCSDLQARDEEIARLGAKVARLERLLQEAEREDEAFRARAADLEARVGARVNPLAEPFGEGRLGWLRETLALAGEIGFKYNLERLGVHARPAPEVRTLAGRFALAQHDLERALARLAAGSPGAFEEVRKHQALLNACIEGLVAEIGKTKIPKTQKEVV